MTTPPQIKRLRDEIRRHDTLYYVENTPVISDGEYDRLYRKLVDLEKAHPELITPDSPTQRIGGQPTAAFASVTHAVPMFSMDNTYSADELREWDARVRRGLGGEKFSYVVELKVDGVAVNLRYEKGQFTQGATRGDGTDGDDITANLRTVRNIPLNLQFSGVSVPDVLEVRGEIYLPTDAFTRMNRERATAGEPEFANPRNATAGSLKRLDPREVAARPLRFTAHGFGQIEPPIARPPTHSRSLAWIARMGLPTATQAEEAPNIDTVIDLCSLWAARRNELPYEVDGLVVKVNDFSQQETLGQTSKAPRWCIAYKYAAEQAETTLRRIDVQVGKTGAITPVAKLDPVHVSGTMVSRASLHNFEEVARKDVREGDTVVIEKAGEIIPQVVRVVMSRRPADAKPFKPPKTCPTCGAGLVKDEGGVYLRCLNPACPDQLKQRLAYWAGRNQMDIENLGPALIDQLVEREMVRDVADLYALKKEQVVALERMADKSAQNLLDALAESKTRDLARVIAGLAIRNVGTHGAEILADHFGDVDRLARASEEDLAEIHEIGPIVARSIHQFFHSPAGMKLIEHLEAVGVNMESKRRKPAGKQPLAGKTVVVTGTLKGFSRKEIQDLIKANGGRATSSVSASTDFLLIGESPGSKLARARQLGVTILTEEDFIRRVGNE